MKDYPSKHVKKIGFIGTSCAGKTTLALETLTLLKKLGVNADGVLQQDRRFSFQRELLECDPIAQWSFIANQVKAEADMMLRKGVDVLICDRSPLDFYAYYEWQYGTNLALRKFVIEWCRTTYTQLYFLNALPYKDDGMRLDEKGRDEAETFVSCIAADAYTAGAPLFFEDSSLTREMMLQQVVRTVCDTLCETQLALLPEVLDVPRLLVGGSYAFNRQNKTSDVDIYLQAGYPLETGHPTLEKYVKRFKDVYGVPVEVRAVVPEVYEYLRKQGFVEYIKKAVTV